MNKLTPVQALTKAKNLLKTKKWLKKCLATKANGQTECLPTSPTAACFCARGALLKVYNRDHMYENDTVHSAERYLDLVSGGNIVRFNDDPNTTKKDILKKFDEAITLAKKSV